jgi:hypothetical protein
MKLESTITRLIATEVPVVPSDIYVSRPHIINAINSCLEANNIVGFRIPKFGELYLSIDGVLITTMSPPSEPRLIFTPRRYADSILAGEA